MRRLYNVLFALFIYILFLTPTIACTALAEKSIQKKNKTSFVFYSFWAILIPCILAAFRAETVGTDVLVYAKPVYEWARSSNSFAELLALNTRFENGYLFMAYVSSKLFHSFNAMLFFTQLLIILPIYVSAFKIRNLIPATSAMLCYYSFFYVMSFNIMREGIAVSFLLLAFIYLLDNKWINAAVIIFIATLFHSSSLVGAVLIIFVVVLDRIQKPRVRALLVAVVVVSIPVFMRYWEIIFRLLLAWNIIPAKYLFYTRYLKDSYMVGLNRAHFFKMLLRWVGYVATYALLKDNHLFRDDKIGRCIKSGALIGIMIFSSVVFILNSGYGYRVSFYLEILLVFWVAGLNSGIQKIQMSHMPLRSLVMYGMALSCFLIAYMWRGFHGTLPFAFQIYRY